MEATPRLKAGIFVRALLRRVTVEGASGFIVRTGSEEAGAVILVIARLDGTVLVLNQVRDAKGGLGLAAGFGRLERRGPRRCLVRPPSEIRPGPVDRGDRRYKGSRFRR